MRSFAAYLQIVNMGIQMIAEGIETVEERDTLIGLGGDLCQGYLFARPGRAFPTAALQPLREV